MRASAPPQQTFETPRTARPEADEVDEVRAVPWDDLVTAVRDRSWPGLSPWCVEQVEELSTLGDGPLTWPEGDAAALPPAARLSPSVA